MKSVLISQDLSCVGQVSLAVALPVLGASGLQTAALPTAILSTHTGGFGENTFLDLSASLRAIVSQRLVRKPDGIRIPAAEVMLNTRHVAELIERGEVQAIKDAMEQTLAPGSQTFEQDLFRLYRDGTITLDEALANADSPTNLSWLINNSDALSGNGMEEKKQDQALEFDTTNANGTSFKEFTLSLGDSDEA